ncbi:MAG: nuclease [Vezdaea aestivalis]|nr:MAG: nuclease [Vezdaea aestivalis]
MSKKTLALIAAASAASGAAITATILGSRRPTPPGTRTLPPGPRALPRVPPPLVPVPPVDPSGVFQYGFPGPVVDVATRPSLVSAFDRRTRNPHWVAEHITPASLALQNADRKNSYFEEDQSIPATFRAKLADYYKSGYDRGHQVPAADAKWSQEAMDDTFFLSNMCPQVGDGFNRDYWAHVEDFCRRLTGRFPSVRIVTGPLYLPQKDADGKWRVAYEVIGDPPNISVPTHFYKVVFCEEGRTGEPVSLGAFVLPNKEIPNETPLSNFEVPVEVVERASGLTFVDNLPVTQRKRLCDVVQCDLIVRQFGDRQRKMSGRRS